LKGHREALPEMKGTKKEGYLSRLVGHNHEKRPTAAKQRGKKRTISKIISQKKGASIRKKKRGLLACHRQKRI